MRSLYIFGVLLFTTCLQAACFDPSNPGTFAGRDKVSKKEVGMMVLGGAAVAGTSYLVYSMYGSNPEIFRGEGMRAIGPLLGLPALPLINLYDRYQERQTVNLIKGAYLYQKNPASLESEVAHLKKYYQSFQKETKVPITLDQFAKYLLLGNLNENFCQKEEGQVTVISLPKEVEKIFQEEHYLEKLVKGTPREYFGRVHEVEHPEYHRLVLDQFGNVENFTAFLQSYFHPTQNLNHKEISPLRQKLVEGADCAQNSYKDNFLKHYDVEKLGFDVEKIAAQNLHCMVCLGKIKEGNLSHWTQFQECGHYCCKDCRHGIMLTDDLCPMCRRPLGAENPVLHYDLQSGQISQEKY